jgi:hypothetical protein
MFAFLNTKTSYETISMRIKSKSFNPGDIDLTKTYQNDVNYNEFITYEINPATNS